MKKLFLGLGLVLVSISTYALDLKPHEIPAYLIEQVGYSGPVTCTYKTVLVNGTRRTFKATMFNECEQVLAIGSVGTSSYNTVARIPYTTSRTFVTFIGVKPRKMGRIYIIGRSDPCDPGLSHIPRAVADCKNKQRAK